MDAIKLVVSIVERGKGVAMQRLYGQRQVFLHLQCAGRGTATSEILDILGLGSSEKDVVFSFASAPSAHRLLQDLDSDLRGSVGTSGIVFSLPLSGLNNLAAALVVNKTTGGAGVPLHMWPSPRHPLSHHRSNRCSRHHLYFT